MTVENMTIENFFDGIYLHLSSDNTLSSNNLTANREFGINLGYSSANTLSGNNVAANTANGIAFDSYSNYNVLSGNNVTANGHYGISLGFCSFNTLSGNNFTNNPESGLWLYKSPSNTLSGNNFVHNSKGVKFDSSSNNTIYHNCFINNTFSQVDSYNSTNIWDNGSLGNYWSDYLTRYPNATQVDSSGIWNTPYVIDTNNADNYPLMAPIVVIPEFPSSLVLSLFMIATLLAVIIYKKKAVKQARVR